MTDRYKEFLEKLEALSVETGMHIEMFGDAYYNPKVVDSSPSEESKKVSETVYFSYDSETKKYVGRLGCPYSGEFL
jgi:hypothetical protein